MRFASQITRRFSDHSASATFCLADHPTRRNVVSRLPNTAKCRFQVTRLAKFLFSRSHGFEIRLADHPAFSRSPGEMSFPGYPTRRNVVPRLPGSRNFFSRSPGSGIHDCVIQANEAGDSESEPSLGPRAAGARSLSGRGSRWPLRLARQNSLGSRPCPGKLKRDILPERVI